MSSAHHHPAPMNLSQHLNTALQCPSLIFQFVNLPKRFPLQILPHKNPFSTPIESRSMFPIQFLKNPRLSLESLFSRAPLAHTTSGTIPQRVIYIHQTSNPS